MKFSARRAFQSLCMGIFVIALLHVIVYQWKPPQKAGQFNFARKINEALNGGNFVQQDDSSRRSRNMKFYIAFKYWEQLSMATNNLIALTALASYSGHQVVVPFVNDSKFFGYKMSSDDTQTLALYYNLSAFNNTLRSHGYSTLVSWETFQSVCRDKLDLLIRFSYGEEASRRQQTTEIQGFQTRFGFNISKTVRVDSGMLRSVESFLDKVVKGSKCVGIQEWRGNMEVPERAFFPLPMDIHSSLSLHHVAFFNEKLLEIVDDFMNKTLGSNYISHHIRTEQILKRSNGNFTTLVNCIKKQASLIKNIRARHPNYNKLFVAVDFTEFGSQSKWAREARGKASLLLKHLNELFDNMVFLQPQFYKIKDKGAVAIVEMALLASGKELFLTGGGCFQHFMAQQFMKRSPNSFDKVYGVCNNAIDQIDFRLSVFNQIYQPSLTKSV